MRVIPKRFIGGLLALFLILAACTKTPSQPTPQTPSEQQAETTQQEAGSFSEALQKAREAAAAGDAEQAKQYLQVAFQMADSETDKALVNEMLDDAEKGKLEEIVEDIDAYLGGQAMTFETLLQEALEAAKVEDKARALAELNEALEMAETDAQKAMVQELIDDVEKEDFEEVIEDIETYLGQHAAEGGSPEEQKARQLFVQMGCFTCHGQRMEGNIGPIIAGLPVETIKQAVRNGFPEAEVPMPAFSQEQLSDEDLDILARFISSRTLDYTGIEIPEPVANHLQMAWDALEANDRAGVEKHLKAALEALPPDGPEGLRVTLEDLIEDLEEEDSELAGIEQHLRILVGK